MSLTWNEKTGLPYIPLSLDRSKWSSLNITQRLFTAWSKKNGHEMDGIVMAYYSFWRRINVQNGCSSNIISEEEYDVPVDLLALDKIKKDGCTHMAIGCFEMDFKNGDMNGPKATRIVGYLIGFIKLNYENLFFKSKYTKGSGLSFHSIQVPYKEYIIIESNEIHCDLNATKEVEQEESIEIQQSGEIQSDQTTYYIYIFHDQAPTKSTDKLFLKELIMTTINGNDKLSMYIINRVKILCTLYNSRYKNGSERPPRYLMKEIEEAIPIRDIQSYDMERMCLWVLIIIFCRDKYLKNWFIQAEMIMLDVNLGRLDYKYMDQIMAQNDMELPKDGDYEQYIVSMFYANLEEALEKAVNVPMSHSYFLKLSEKCMSIVKSHS